VKKKVGSGEEADFIGAATVCVGARGAGPSTRKKSSARRTLWVEVILHGRHSMRVDIPAMRGSPCSHCSERRWCISVAVAGIRKNGLQDVGCW
jgi:hypothetical protein